MLVKVKKGRWVNPKYVTTVGPAYNWDCGRAVSVNPDRATLWVVGNAGYGTMEVCADMSPETLVDLLNSAEVVRDG